MGAKLGPSCFPDPSPQVPAPVPHCASKLPEFVSDQIDHGPSLLTALPTSSLDLLQSVLHSGLPSNHFKTPPGPILLPPPPKTLHSPCQISVTPIACTACLLPSTHAIIHSMFSVNGWAHYFLLIFKGSSGGLSWMESQHLQALKR